MRTCVCGVCGCAVGGQVLLAWTVDVSCACNWFSGWLGCFLEGCAPHNFVKKLVLFYIRIDAYVMLLFYV